MAAIALLFAALAADMHVADAFSVGEFRGRLISSDSSLASTTDSLEESTKSSASASSASSSSLPDRKIALLLCPAQFCVPEDYCDLWDTLPSHVEISEGDDSTTTTRVAVDKDSSRVVPLSRRDWIKVSKQLPTKKLFRRESSSSRNFGLVFRCNRGRFERDY